MTLPSKISPIGQQVEALSFLKSWWHLAQDHKSPRPFFALYGHAGTGKTSLIQFFLQDLKLDPSDVKLMTFTGKAARVITQRTGLEASTIHSFIYQMEELPNRDLKWIKRSKEEISELYSVWVLDEWSMIGTKMFQDLLSFEVPLILLGDPNQLPPVGDQDLIHQIPPDYFLTEIHRQALENPIIYLANEVRQGKQIPYGEWGGVVSKIHKEDVDPEVILSVDSLLVGLNQTRHHMNRWFREVYGHTSYFPEAEEKLICLRNNREEGIFNGMLLRTQAIARMTKNDHILQADLWVEDTDVILLNASILADRFQEILGPGGQPSIPLSKDGFPEHFTPWMKKKVLQLDYGYAITVHKSQGSQYPFVALFEEWPYLQTKARWLYTGVTRAMDRLLIIE